MYNLEFSLIPVTLEELEAEQERELWSMEENLVCVLPFSRASMKFVEQSNFTDRDAAGRQLIEIANTILAWTFFANRF